MKKTITLLLLFIFSCSIPGCVADTYRIMGIKLYAVASERPEGIPYEDPYNVLDNNIYFLIEAELEQVNHSISLPSTIDRAQAFQPGKDYLNHFLQESLELRFDIPIVFEGMTIEAGEDLLSVPRLRERLMIRFYEERITIISDDDLIHEIEFGSDEFTVFAVCDTDDRYLLSTSTEVTVIKKQE